MQTKEWRYFDKSEWGPGPWQDEPDKLQWQDEATGLPCLINRRKFLQMFSAVPIVAVPAIELARTIILPPRCGWPVPDHFTTSTLWYIKREYDPGLILHRTFVFCRSGDNPFSYSQFRALTRDSLEEYWRKAIDTEGNLVKFSKDWTAFYGSSDKT